MLGCIYMEKLVEKLKAAGYKLTGPRLAVLRALAGHHHPVSARELHGLTRNADRASVYRALNLFERLYLVNVERMGAEKLYCLADKPHHHIICEKCGRMKKIACHHDFGHVRNFTAIHHHLTLTGICRRCHA